MHFNSQTRLLVVVAHPDDEVLGCGGTILKAIKQGAQVGVMFLGEGISARFPVGQYDVPEFLEQATRRKKETERALKKLGVKTAWFGERLCVQFDTYPFLSLVKDIEEKIKEFCPTMLFTHNPSEVNIDHRITYEAVEVASRPVNDWFPKEIYAFEVACSGNWKLEPYFTNRSKNV